MLHAIVPPGLPDPPPGLPGPPPGLPGPPLGLLDQDRIRKIRGGNRFVGSPGRNF